MALGHGPADLVPTRKGKILLPRGWASLREGRSLLRRSSIAAVRSAAPWAPWTEEPRLIRAEGHAPSRSSWCCFHGSRGRIRKALDVRSRAPRRWNGECRCSSATDPARPATFGAARDPQRSRVAAFVAASSAGSRWGAGRAAREPPRGWRGRYTCSRSRFSRHRRATGRRQDRAGRRRWPVRRVGARAVTSREPFGGMRGMPAGEHPRVEEASI